MNNMEEDPQIKYKDGVGMYEPMCCGDCGKWFDLLDKGTECEYHDKKLPNSDLMDRSDNTVYVKCPHCGFTDDHCHSFEEPDGQG